MYWHGREGTPCSYLVPASDFAARLLPAAYVHMCVCSPTEFFLCPLLFFYQLPVPLLITLPAWGLRSARSFLQLKASQGTIFGDLVRTPRSC